MCVFLVKLKDQLLQVRKQLLTVVTHVTMTLQQVPVLAVAVEDRLQVAAIDFGTTYSGYALSFKADYKNDPLKVITNQWQPGAGRAASLKVTNRRVHVSSCLYSSLTCLTLIGYEI